MGSAPRDKREDTSELTAMSNSEVFLTKAWLIRDFTSNWDQ